MCKKLVKDLLLLLIVVSIFIFFILGLALIVPPKEHPCFTDLKKITYDVSSFFPYNIRTVPITPWWMQQAYPTFYHLDISHGSYRRLLYFSACLSDETLEELGCFDKYQDIDFIFCLHHQNRINLWAIETNPFLAYYLCEVDEWFEPMQYYQSKYLNVDQEDYIWHYNDQWDRMTGCKGYNYHSLRIKRFLGVLNYPKLYQLMRDIKATN